MPPLQRAGSPLPPPSKSIQCLTWAVTEAYGGRHIQRLEVLGLAGCCCHGCLLGPKDGIDGGGLAHIGVANQPNHQAPAGVLPAKPPHKRHHNKPHTVWDDGWLAGVPSHDTARCCYSLEGLSW